MSRLPRIAVVGVGHLGKIHARIWAENPRAELAFVVDVDEERARAVADEIEFDPRRQEEIEERLWRSSQAAFALRRVSIRMNSLAGLLARAASQ